jgi:DNA polymerase
VLAQTFLFMPLPPLHLDYEAFSKVDLKKVGSYRYSFDPSTEILCAAMAIGDEEPEIWSQLDDGGPKMERYWDALENPDVLIYAHSAQMEMAMSQALMWKTWGIKCPDLRRFRCSASLARRAALPASLDKLGEVLGLEHLKDKRGKALIKKFCVMQSPKKPTKKNPVGRPAYRIRPQDDLPAFTELCNYCVQDVRAEQGAVRKLAYFDEPINNANYSLDAIINARGVTVNLDALRHAQKLIEEETEIVSEKFRKLTGFEVTQNARLLEWLKAQDTHEFQFENLQAETIDNFLEAWEEAPAEQIPLVVEALRLKQSIAYASIKKVATMLACAGPHDNRIRGMLNHHGATTGRWTASLVQFQNMKRPSVKFTEDAYREICNGISRDMLELCYGPVLEVISSCIRHFVHDTNL